MSVVTALALVSVNVALPSEIGIRRRRPVISGIYKLPVRNGTVSVTETGIVGDGQGDLVAHGGPEKAVYAYPAEHLPVWSAEHRVSEPYGPGVFGENLTLAGLDESAVHIGDRWRWGDVVLEVCQPRYPCYKLGMKLGRPKVVREMVENGRTGWYLRVIEPGEAPSMGELELIGRSELGVSVADAHLARLPTADPQLIDRVLAESRLAARLQESLRQARAES
jgi:MOSC domain-containing protein YiiM